eukprot:m.179045 g.179045  ORF g.179045 m.179045 type:complete len:464 (+) comp31954_c3_seq8:114-1505(+)
MVPPGHAGGGGGDGGEGGDGGGGGEGLGEGQFAAQFAQQSLKALGGLAGHWSMQDAKLPPGQDGGVGDGGGGGDGGDDDAEAEAARIAEAAKEKEQKAAKQKKEEERARAVEEERIKQQQQQEQEEEEARKAAEQQEQEKQEQEANEERRRAQEAAEKAKQQQADAEKLETEKKMEEQQKISAQQAQAKPEPTPVVIPVTVPVPVVVGGGDAPVTLTPTPTQDVGVAPPPVANTLQQHPDVQLQQLMAAQKANEYNRQIALTAVEQANQNKDIALHHFNADQQLEQQRQLDFLIQQQRLQLEKQLMEFNKMTTGLQQELKVDNTRKNSAIEIMQRQSMDMQDTSTDDLRSVPRGRSSRSEFDNQTHMSTSMSMTSTSPSKRGRRSSKEDDSTTSFRVKQAQARLAQQEAALTLTAKAPRRLSQQAVQASHDLSDRESTSKVLDSNGVWMTKGGVLTGDGKLAA